MWPSPGMLFSRENGLRCQPAHMKSHGNAGPRKSIQYDSTSQNLKTCETQQGDCGRAYTWGEMGGASNKGCRYGFHGGRGREHGEMSMALQHTHGIAIVWVSLLPLLTLHVCDVLSPSA